MPSGSDSRARSPIRGTRNDASRYLVLQLAPFVPIHGAYVFGRKHFREKHFWQCFGRFYQGQVALTHVQRWTALARVRVVL